MNPGPVERRLAAILSADAAGYSRLMAEDEVATVQTLTAYREEMTVLIRQRRGRVVDSPGDNLLAEFPSALDATHCAVELQRVLAARNADRPPERKMEFRIGVHLGDVMVEGERIYGDGVNIAARLESLAEPGGICLSAAVVDQVKGKVAARFRSLGERTLKNIPWPVRAFAVAPGGTVPAAAATSRASRSLLIAPFASLSASSEDAYLARGLAEDVATLLVGNPDFAILPRPELRSEAGEAADPLVLARQAGARYALSGSVRRAGDRLRVAASLLDTESQAQIWGDRYDRAYADLFELQDDIVDAVAKALHSQLWHAEVRRARQKDPENLDAWSLVQRGIGTVVVGGAVREALREGETLLRRALEIEPDYALAQATLALVLGNQVRLLYSRDPARDAAEALDLAQRAAERAPQDPRVAFRVGGAYWRLGRAEQALPFLERSLRVDSNWLPAQADLGQALVRTGRIAEGLERLRDLVEKGRGDPQLYVFEFYLAYGLVVAGDLAGAEMALRRSLQAWDRLHITWAVLALVLALRGRIDEAREAFDRARKLEPDIPTARYEDVLRLALAESQAEPLVALLRRIAA